MKLLALLIGLMNVTAIGQDMNKHYFKDTFELSDSYLYNELIGWFTTEGDVMSINFRVDQGDGFDVHPWLKSGNYSTPITLLTDKTFSFDIKWEGKKGEKSCTLIGEASNDYLKKQIKFSTKCKSELRNPSMYSMSSSDAWPGFVPDDFGYLSGTVIKATIYGREINEPMLDVRVLDAKGDSVNCAVLGMDGIDFMTEDAAGMCLGKKIELVYYKQYSSDDYHQAWKMILVED